MATLSIPAETSSMVEVISSAEAAWLWEFSENAAAVFANSSEEEASLRDDSPTE